ncbi:MAG: hypothetical protein HOP29_09100 [Phycisphaerales bacterium]|nr:hypothetical protein [Phycisphaerales bacterium]
MNRAMGLGMSVLVMAPSAGCGNLGTVLDALGVSSDTVTLKLVNETPFRVEPEVFVTDTDLGLEFVTEELVTLGVNRLAVEDLAPGVSVTRTFDCDDIEALMASEAELKTGLGISPDADSDLFVQGEQFECGDTVTLRYTGGVGDFSARINAQRFDALGLLQLVAPR